MGATSLIDAAPAAAAGSRREQVLVQLRAAAAPLSVAAIAEQTGLHINTARFHLDVLVADGLAERSTEARSEPGRPRVLYQARGPLPGPRSYRLLADILTSLVASLPDAAPAAERAGRLWGSHLVERPAPSRSLDARESLGRLTQLLEQVGFQPETTVEAPDEPQIALHHCPFREIAEQHQQVVCALHLGLMRGALEEIRAPLTTTSLEPFVTPTRCVARLRAENGPARREPRRRKAPPQ